MTHPTPARPYLDPSRSRRVRRLTRSRCRRTRIHGPSEWSRSNAPRPSWPTTRRSRRIYGALLAGTAWSARGRAPIPTSELPTLAAASFALSKLVVHEKVESWVRRPFVDERRRKPKGRRLRYAVGELLTCTRCTGAWSALGLVALRVHSPAAGRTVSTVLAASAGNDMLQAAFQYLCAHANTESSSPRTRRCAPGRPVPRDRVAPTGDVSCFGRQRFRPRHG